MRFTDYVVIVLEDFLLGDGVTWAGNRPVVADEVARRFLALHRVEVGKD